MVTRSIDVDNTNDCISRRSVFIGSGTFSTTIIKDIKDETKDEEQDASIHQKCIYTPIKVIWYSIQPLLTLKYRQ